MTPQISLEYSEGALRRRPATLADLLAVREVSDPVLSPDGEWTAFLVRQAILRCNCYRTAIYLAPSDGGRAPSKVLEEDLLSELRWSRDSRFLTYLSSRGGSRQLWQVAHQGGEPELVFSHAGGEGPTYHESALSPRGASRIGVDLYEWSPNGLQVAFVSRPSTDSTVIRGMIQGGVIYDDDRMGSRDILLKQWSHEPAELWIYNTRTRSRRRIWQAPNSGLRFSYGLGISSIAWSPRGDKIALTYAANVSKATAVPNFELGVLATSTGHFVQLTATDSMLESNPTWSRDGTRIAYGSVFLTAQDHTGELGALGIVDPVTGHNTYVGRSSSGRSIDGLWWTDSDTTLVFETASPSGAVRERSGLYAISAAGGRVRRRTAREDHLSACSSQVGERVACIHQRPDVAPTPVTANLNTGSVRKLAMINPQLRELSLTSVTELRWRDQAGVETNGYLLRPPDDAAGKRYPMVVLLYGFQGRFLTAAEWITSYPSQVLASSGFVVLLANYPRYPAWRGDNYTKGSLATGDGALSSLEAVIRLLGAQGLVDTMRVGVAGWSMGGFIAGFAISHSKLFQVASLGNDGDYNPGTYWLSGWRGYRRFMENTLGGPPYGASLTNWLAFSPALNARHVGVPVLMEASSEEAIAGLEMYSALRHYRVPVEYVIYPDDGHVFTQPVHRLASMERNLDWFSYWLLGKEDPDPIKRTQYQRWRAIRDSLRLLKSARTQESAW